MAIVWSPAPADARDSAKIRLDIHSASLSTALAELSREANVSIGTDGSLPGRRTHAVKGTMTLEQALAKLLAGSGYVARQVGPTAWRIERARPAPKRPVAPPDVPPPKQTIVTPEPIVVMGSKRQAELNDLPIAVSVVDIGSAEVSRSDPYAGTSAIAGSIDGLTITAQGSGRNRMFLRGIADSPFNGESQSTVAVVLDDARLTYAAPDPDIALVDIERVEVLKGPQGALYGTGALGGIYHLVSRRADLAGSSAEFAAGSEFVSRGTPGYSLSAVANLPLVRDRLGLRLVGYSRSKPGWIDTGNRDDSNSLRTLGLRAGVGLDAGKGWRIDLTGFAQWISADDSEYTYAPGARSRPAQNAEPHDNDLRHGAIRLAREGQDVDIVLSSGFTSHEVSDIYDATVGAGGFGVANPQTLDVSRKYRVWDNEARINGRAGALDWLLGLSALKARQRSTWTLDGTAASLVVDDDYRNTTDLAVFGDVTVPLGARFSLDAGARLFHSTVDAMRTQPANADTRRLVHSGITPNVALSWRPDDSKLAFIRYGSAIRQSGIGPARPVRSDPVEGDELAMIEAGWRQEFAGGARLELGAYFTVWENLQSDMLQPNGLIAVRTAGKALIEGVEGSVALPLGQDWDLALGGTLQHTRLVRNDLGIELDDRSLPAIPNFVLRGSVERRFTVGQNPASLRLRLRYVGHSRLSFDPLLDRPMGDYLESGIEGRIDFGRFGLTLALDNILGQDTDQFAFGNPLRFFTMRQFTPQPPVNGSITLHSSF
jgi:outer membrane receptor protein involved in Fe transport